MFSLLFNYSSTLIKKKFNINYPLSILSSNLIFALFACNCWEIFVVLFPPGKLQAKYYIPVSNSGWLSLCCALIYTPHLTQFLSSGGTLRLVWFYFYLLDSFPTCLCKEVRKGVAEGDICTIYFSYPAIQPDIPVAASLNLPQILYCWTIP